MKKRLLLLVLLALMLSLFSLGFAATVQVGDGTTTTYDFPICGGYQYSYSQQIYTQTKINHAGTITKIRFFCISGEITTNRDWTIYMGHTQKTEFNSNTDWEPVANLTQVFDGDVSSMIPEANNWMEITLQTPFIYNNNDNLLIAVNDYNPNHSGLSWEFYTSGTNTRMCYYSNSTIPNPDQPIQANLVNSDISHMELAFSDIAISHENRKDDIMLGGNVVASGTDLPIADATINVGEYGMITTINSMRNETTAPPIGVLAEVADQNVNVTWLAPETTGGSWLSYCGNKYESIGLTFGGNFQVAVRYPPGYLTSYIGMDLQAVKVWPAQAAGFAVKVWTGGTINTPGPQVLHQPFTADLDVYNTIVLAEPVTVTGNEELWFGYEITQTSGYYPAGCDAGPAVNGYGNMIYYQGAWSTLLGIAPSLNYNWCIEGYVGYSTPTDAPRITSTGSEKSFGGMVASEEYGDITRALEGYSVWRLLQGQEDNEADWTSLTADIVNNTTLTDTDWGTIGDGSYRWAVKAMYTNNLVSVPTFSNVLSILRNDLAANSISGAIAPSLGVPSTYTVVVENMGTDPKLGTAYTVKLMGGDMELASVPGVDIQPGATHSFTISWNPTTVGPMSIYGRVVLPLDTVSANDETDSLNIIVLPEAIQGYVIGTGTNTHSYPFNASNGYTRSLGLYTADQKGSLGVINSLGWSVASAGSAAIPYKIYAKLTTDTELTQMGWNDFTSDAVLVKEGVYTFDSTGWHYFALDNPVYHTHGNLLIGVEANYGGSGAGSGNYPQFHYTTSTTNSHQYWYKNNNPLTGTGSRNNRLPDLFLAFSPLSDDPMISITPPDWNFGRMLINNSDLKTFTITNVGNGTLNLTGISPMTDGFFEVIGTPPFPLSLDFDQSISFMIQYAPTVAGNHTAIFTLVAENSTADLVVSGDCYDPIIYEYPFFDGFEEWQMDGTQVQEWTQRLDDGKTCYWMANSSQSDHNRYPRNGSFNATLSHNSNAWLMRPFYLETGRWYEVEVWARSTYNSEALIGLYYGISATVEAMTNTIKSQTCTGRRLYQPIRGVFSPATNGIYWLGVHGVNRYSYYLSIDDFSVRQLPADHVISFVQDEVDFGTILAGSTTEYQGVSLTNISSNLLVLNSANISIVGVNANMFEYNPSNLPLTINSSQSRNFPVRYVPSGAGEHSAILRITIDGVHHDLTLYGKALPVGSIYESFEGTQFPPPGWYGNWSQSTEYAIHGTKSAYINGLGQLSTPLLAIEDNDKLSFWVYRTSSSGALQLVYSQDGITWAQLGADLSLQGSYTWFEYTIDLSSLSGGNYYLGLRTNSTYAQLSVDMFMGPKVIPLATDAVSIGEGDASSSYFPIFGNYDYSYTQQIYTQAQINQSGEITKIRFFYTSGDIAPNKDWTIYLGHTSKMAFASNTDWETLTNLTQVFSGDVTTMITETNNWMEIPLQTPFLYNNVDNLIIAVHQSTPGGASMSWGAFSSAANTGICYYSNSTNPNPSSPPAATFRLASVNRIQLDFPNPAAPMTPLLVSPDNGSQLVNGQSLSWTLPEGSAYASGYDIYIDDNLVSVNHPNNYYQLTNLALGMHNWYVVAHNNLGSSAPSETRTFILAQEVIIGTGTNYMAWPFNTGYGYTRSLGIYTAEKIGQHGVINTMGWSVATTQNTSVPYKIYAKLTNETYLSSMTWSQFTSGASLVKEGTHIFDSTGWHNFTLDIPIDYTGGNLLIGVEANYGGSGTSTPQFHYTTSGVITHQSWSSNHYAPTGSGSRDSNLPNLLLILSVIPDDIAITSYPWIEDFDSTAAGQMPEDWTIIASHTGADNRGWKVASDVGASSAPHAAVVYSHDDYAKDEWMISVPFRMQAGQAYHISFKVKGENEALALHWGIAPNVATMTSNAALYDNNQINYSNWTEVKVMFVPDATGVYYFGWHAYTPVGEDYIAVDDISITVAPNVDLAATGLGAPTYGDVGTSIDLSVTVKNMGGNTQTYCDLYIKEQGTDAVLAQEQIIDLINPNESKTYTVNWTPTTFGNISIYAEVNVAGDADASNNCTSAEQVLIYPEGIYLGDPASVFVSDSCPFNLSYEDFVAETVYLASEIQATGGVIHALAYYNNFPTAQSIPAQIWMKNTAAINLIDGWLPWNGYQLVFDGIIECPAGFNEVLIPITHFNYTGGNLAIRTSKTWEDKWVANHNWLLTRDRVHPNRTRVYQTDIQNLDHTNPPTGNLIDYLPNVTFFMEIVDIVSAPVVAISALESDLVLNWEPVPGAGAYKVYASEDPYNFGSDPIATVDTNSFTMPTTATRRFFKVTSVGGRALGGRGAVMGKLAPREFIVIDDELWAEPNEIEKAKSGFMKRP